MVDSIEKKKDQVYIGHLSRKLKESDLKEEFKKFGNITDMQFKNGFAFIVSRFSKDHRPLARVARLMKLLKL